MDEFDNLFENLNNASKRSTEFFNRSSEKYKDLCDRLDALIDRPTIFEKNIEGKENAYVALEARVKHLEAAVFRHSKS